MHHTPTPRRAPARRSRLSLASFVTTLALAAGAALPGAARADEDTPPLPAHYEESACHALVMDAGRMIAWARWEQRMALDKVRASPFRDGTPDWVVSLVGDWITDAYEWKATDEQVFQWAAELGSTKFLPKAAQLTKHETIAIWLRRIARGCPHTSA